MTQDEEIETLRCRIAEKSGIRFVEKLGSMKVGFRITHPQAGCFGVVKYIAVGSVPRKGIAVMAWENGRTSCDVFDIGLQDLS